MKTIVLIFAELLAASLLQVGKASDVPGRVSYEKLKDGPWKIQRWDERYPLVFLTYGGQWPAQDRIAHECKKQSLLTPTWEDPKFAHPIESRATEWGWSMEWRPSGCTTRRECYEKVKKQYLERIRYRQYPGTNDPLIKQGEKFYMLSMQATYLLCGAEWGCDMVGIETGENLGANNILTTFVRGAARQSCKPFYVQPSPWHMGSVPFYLPGDDDTTQHQLTEEQIKAALGHEAGAIPNGGHSSYYLFREWYHAWLAGAAVVCPEGCQSNFFAGNEKRHQESPPDVTIPLSPIGRRAQKFLSLTRRHPDIGVPYTPFALMFDEYCGYTGFREQVPCPWNGLKPSWSDWEIVLFFEALFPGHMELVFTPETMLPPRDERYKTHVHPERVSVPTPYSEGYDALLSSVPHDVLKSYPVVICLGEHEFLPQTVGKLVDYLRYGGRLCLTYQQAAQLGMKGGQDQTTAFQKLRQAGKVDLYGLKPSEIPTDVDSSRWTRWGRLVVYEPEKETEDSLQARHEATKLLPHEERFVKETGQLLGHLCAEYLPVRVSGNIQYTLNRTRTGWLIGLFNNEGATKTHITPVVIDPSKTQRVTARAKEGNIKSAREWCEEKEVPVRNGEVTVEVPPGEVRIVELIAHE
ncbi:MAG: hypothetical protein ABSF26_28720 [Thermoguttaceae bacterium]|jgi:hypothetical protein